MKIRSFLLAGLVWLMGITMAFAQPAPMTEADFVLGGINAATDTLEQALAKGGKLKVDYERDTMPPSHIWVFDRVRMYTLAEDDSILALCTEDKNVETARGIRLGMTRHKIVKEYGEPHEREMKDGTICYIYKMGDKRVVFDITPGHVQMIVINCMPPEKAAEAARMAEAEKAVRAAAKEAAAQGE